MKRVLGFRNIYIDDAGVLWLSYGDVKKELKPNERGLYRLKKLGSGATVNMKYESVLKCVEGSAVEV